MFFGEHGWFMGEKIGGSIHDSLEITPTDQLRDQKAMADGYYSYMEFMDF